MYSKCNIDNYELSIKVARVSESCYILVYAQNI